MSTTHSSSVSSTWGAGEEIDFTHLDVEDTASLWSTEVRPRRVPIEQASFLIMSIRLLTKMRNLENAVYGKYLRKCCVRREESKYIGGARTSRNIGTVNFPVMIHSIQKEEQTVRTCQTLTAEQKCTIIQTAMDELRKRIIRLEKRMASNIVRYKTNLEALTVSRRQLTKRRNQFDTYVTKSLENLQTYPSSNASERFNVFQRYHKAYTLCVERDIECIKLENTSLRRCLNRYLLTIREGENLGETAEAIDLEHMRVQCHNSMQKLQELEIHCVDVKACTVKLVQVLASQKSELAKLLRLNQQIHDDTLHVLNSNMRLKNDIDKHRQLIREERTSLADLKQKLSSYKVPPVYDYANLVLRVSNLTRERCIQERKKAIAQLKLKRHKQMWRQILKQSGRRSLCTQNAPEGEDIWRKPVDRDVT